MSSITDAVMWRSRGGYGLSFGLRVRCDHCPKTHLHVFATPPDKTRSKICSTTGLAYDIPAWTGDYTRLKKAPFRR